MKPGTVRIRVDTLGRDVGRAAAAGLDVPPKQRPPALDPHVWLELGAAGRLIGASPSAVMGWRDAGLLPRTRFCAPGGYRYHRGDLERIAAAPRRNNGINWDATRALINSDTVPAL